MKTRFLFLLTALAFSSCCEEREDFSAVIIEKQKLQKNSGEVVGYLFSFKNKLNTVQKSKVFEKWANEAQVGDTIKGHYDCGEIKVEGFAPRPKETP
jgi:hypothetical protein